MKKSLSVVLSATVALSMFSSVAFGKTSADFTDLKGLDAATQAKFDAMISAGIFDGVSDTTFGLKDEMNRAQFAKVAALIMGLDINKDLTTSSFEDVKADDPANGYALPYIEALKTAGVTDGYADGQYNPAGKVTKEQLATFLVRVLGKDADAKAMTGNDATVSTWAQGYVKLALDLKLLPNGEDGTFGGMANATRDLLLTGAYEAKQQYVPAGKVSVTGAKATGVQKVTVSFNKPVDTDKAKLALTKGTADVATTVQFADDKKSAVLTLTDTKIGNGDYTVTMSGLDQATVDKTTATFTGEDEVLKSIDFVTAGDTIAYADKVIVKAKAVNQYGEAASTNAGSYNVYTSAATFTKITKDTDGNLLITLDTKTDGTTQGVSVIPVTIVNNDSHITATKNYKLGTQPILTKLELGSARYSSGTALNGKGENVAFDLNFYDQYGGNMSYEMMESANQLKDTNVIWNDYIDSKDITWELDDNGNDIPEVKISLLNNLDKAGDFNFTVFNQAATASGKITVASTKVANKIEIGEMDDVIASGDTDVYIPVVAYDAAGNQLSVDDLTSDQNVGRINVSLSGAVGDNDATNVSIENSGEHKGSIKLHKVTSSSKGAVSVTAVIATANANSTATKTFTVADARVADHFKEVTAPAKGAVAGGTSKFEYNVIDQYGKVLDDSVYSDSVGNGSETDTGSLNHYTVAVTAIAYDANNNKITDGSAYVQDAQTVPQPVSNDADHPTVYGIGSTNGDFKAFNDEFKFVTTNAAKEGTHVDYTAVILKNGVELAKVTKTLTVAKATDDLTYSVDALNPMFNALDSGVVTQQVYGNGQTLTVDAQQSPVTSMLGQEITVSAKNAAGDVVELPSNIKSVASSNTAVARVELDAANNKAFAIGNKAGTATISITYLTAKGEVKQATVPVTVKEDAIAVDKIEAETKTVAINSGENVFDKIDLKVTDNYGTEYDNMEAGEYNYLLGLTFAATNVKGGTVSIDQYGNVTASAGTVTFDLTTVAPNGKSVVTPISVTK
ncbi:S-layer homology domain-containing protein [Paenibacillus aestuarii]|uniref:S-layer homology domain-containing protein n=1 Tax=Paenibacillus aestuarii TaxID=516965 RepID=A0ABW0KF47_9BACL|nr:S-layer homology domain-containing protein [Paenibacillus aestuarii]